MPQLPSLSGRKAVNKFKDLGYEVDHVTGSHKIMVCEGYPTISVPDHGGKDVKKGTLRGIIEDAGLTLEEFLSGKRNPPKKTSNSEDDAEAKANKEAGSSETSETAAER